MIKKLIGRLLGRSGSGAKAAPLGKRVEIGAEQHGIDSQLLDERAVRVVRTLQDAGHEAYIVGGAVRDLLLGLRPKDFDVATDATPEQVKALFRRAFVIGRRFRIVHVIFGRGRDHEVIEVSTFRALLDAAAADQVSGNEKSSKHELSGKAHVVDAEGRVLRDNVWGPQIEDAARRDFTVNALYYDPTRQLVVDYHHGWRDARQRVLRMIGDPATRYREDPVRIVRVLRFSAKLGFVIDAKTQAPMRELAALLANVPASRMFDEMFKLLQTGHARKSLEVLRAQALPAGLFPVLDVLLDPAQRDAARERFIELALDDTDRRVADGLAVAPSFLLACLLWHEVLQRWGALQSDGLPPFPALQQAVDAVFDARIGDISGRGKLAADMREIWLMQPRFERRSGSTPRALIEQPRYRAAYDFLRLRADAGQVGAELAEWWEDFALGDEDERVALLQAVREREKPRRAAKPRAAPAGAAKADEGDAAMPAPGEAHAAAGLEGEAAPRKRRRRRRKPAAAAEAVADAAAGQAAEQRVASSNAPDAAQAAAHATEPAADSGGSPAAQASLPATPAA
ncbi:MAG TPA: polynucleotide adenylyltransferase PcnB [Rubrivivax sp.]|nr:polynucleotide adenylyltransferase PcnB [Rubrivivax sp.]HPO19424.1 polynucleotide adenylyltransferase PcnB [Rubrivivax sp.]